MKKKLVKLTWLFLIIVLIIGICMNVVCFADDGFSAAGISGSTSNFDDKGNTSELVNMTNNSATLAISVMRIVGVTIAVVMLLVIAIKYMVSSASDRADIKKHAVVYVVGAVVLFGAVGILGVISDFTNDALVTD